MTSLGGMIRIVRNDLFKALRYAAVSVVCVPIGLALLWLFLQTDLPAALANVVAVTIATIPNYVLNRYWVWQKTGPNSVSREIVPFWSMAFLGLALSTAAVWFADRFSDLDLVFLAVNFMSFGVVWVFKFFVLERFLFGDHDRDLAESLV